MGPIQQSINNLIFTTSLIKSFSEKKEKEAAADEKAKIREERQTELFNKNKEVLEKKDKLAEEKIRSQSALAQEREQRVKNNQIKGQILEQRLKAASAKATARANEEIQAKYTQKSNFKDRHAQALQRRMNLTEPHKPLPKKEE